MKYLVTTLALLAVLALPAQARENSVVQTVQTTDVKFKAPADNTLYSCASLAVPAGTWSISYRALVYSSRPKIDTGTIEAIVVLSTEQGGTWPSPAALVSSLSMARVGGGLFRMVTTAVGGAQVTFAVPTTVYLSVFQSSGNGWDSLQCLGGTWTPTVIRAVSA